MSTTLAPTDVDGAWCKVDAYWATYFEASAAARVFLATCRPTLVKVGVWQSMLV